MYKHLFSKFIKGHEGFTHLAAHSHHFWPDVTLDAQIQYWEDSAKTSDHKWEKVFGTIIPACQSNIAKTLHLSNPKNIAFAPNTFEFVVRLLSLLDFQKEIKILTTDSEFHSFNRQIDRLKEFKNINIIKVPTFPYESFNERFVQEANKIKYDLIFFSHVFFNSGFRCDINNIVKNIHSKSIIAIDGYHNFMAVPTDLSEIEDKVFYLAGGYKYMGAGEGACFISIPHDNLRPIVTGWFSNFSGLENNSQDFNYDKNGNCFLGSTFDPSGLYRMKAIFELYEKEKIDVDKIHSYVTKHMNNFLDHQMGEFNLKKNQWVLSNNLDHGHFLSFDFKTSENAKKYVSDLYERKIIIDSRANLVRFGFGVYQ